MKATWNGTTLAESDETVVVEGNHYFPVASLNLAHFRKTDKHTTCPWKGEASYYDISVDGKRTRMPPGIIRSPKKARPRSRTASHSGKASSLSRW